MNYIQKNLQRNIQIKNYILKLILEIAELEKDFLKIILV